MTTFDEAKSETSEIPAACGMPIGGALPTGFCVPGDEVAAADRAAMRKPLVAMQKRTIPATGAAYWESRTVQLGNLSATLMHYPVLREPWLLAFPKLVVGCGETDQYDAERRLFQALRDKLALVVSELDETLRSMGA